MQAPGPPQSGADLSSPFFWLEEQGPEEAAFLQTARPFEICSFQLPPETGKLSYSQPEAASLPARGTA